MVADSQEQLLVEKLLIVLQVVGGKLQSLVRVATHRLLQNLWANQTLARRDDHRNVVAVGIHEAERHHTVEPSIGNLFYYFFLAIFVVLAFLGYLLAELVYLVLLATQLGGVFRQDPLHLGFDGGHQLAASLLGKQF